MNCLKPQRRAEILHSLVEGMSQRACSRVFDVDLGTVVKLARDAGDMAIEYLQEVRDLTPAKIQADEIHSFIGAKDKHLQDMVAPFDEAGTVWAYLAMDVESKLIIEYRLGDRERPDANAFAKSLASKLRRNNDGSFAERPTITTDGLSLYKDAFEGAFGSDMNFGMFVKKYATTDKHGNSVRNPRYEGADRRRIVGEIADVDINTSYIERQNGNLRMGNRRYTRRTNAFSKTFIDHERALALWILYHNYCWIPRPARPKAGSPKGTPWRKRLPAAMEAGIETRLWEMADIVALTDAFVAERKKAELEPVGAPPQAPEVILLADDTDVSLTPSHWVFHSHIHDSTKVHAAHCSSCRDGAGRSGSRPGTAEWIPFYCLDDATNAAAAMQPDRNSICSICIGKYRRPVVNIR